MYLLVRVLAGEVDHVVKGEHAGRCLLEVLCRVDVILEAKFLVLFLILWPARSDA